ncbi:type VI secretion system protein ImpE [Plasticicumulans lactativorans]|uniref:Type VI secretion system protein ImpE n=1 Tax=Plasticicumulans lactativorans TaxID=1133106 RepID=A0A4R2KW62_9GAMM|nr:type VI secretion system accessory protein TagJ [Plasticicumulans lactativorans]TCO78103.1 type VI secretion system protein ImpE [Plasticicumulans lactativorans]
MSVEERLREGNTEQALAELQAQVRKEPGSVRWRILLFQLLAVHGQWDRALNQLQVVGELDGTAMPMVQTYREALRCEVLRREVFAGRRAPLVFGDPAPWLAWLIEALAQDATAPAAAQALRAQAFEQAPASTGRIDGEAFAWIADSDGRLGPVLEAVVNGRYYWVPFVRLAAVRIEPPADLRDLVWAPAELTFANGGTTVALIPTRYPGAEAAADGALQLARRTDWSETAEGLVLAHGQRMFATDAGEYPLLNVREIALDVEGGAAAAAPADG